MDGLVEISSGNGATWPPAHPGAPIPAGQFLRTGDDGACVIAFSDHMVVALKPRTTIAILPTDRALRLELASGWIWIQFDAVQPSNRTGILTTTALAEVPGPAIFTMEFNEDGGTIKVIYGSVDVSSFTGKYLTGLQAGESLIIAPNTSTIPYPFNVDAEKATWEPLLAGVTTTTEPGETTSTRGGTTRTTSALTTSTVAGTTRTYPPPDDPYNGVWTRWGITLVVVAGALFVALLAVATILAVVVSRGKRRAATGAALGGRAAGYPAPGSPPPPTYRPPSGYQPPLPYPLSPAAAHKPAAPAAPAAFCRACGAPLAGGARFCRACGKQTGN